MIGWLPLGLRFVLGGLKSRRNPLLENLALHHQLLVVKRSSNHPVHREFAFKRQWAVQTSRGNGFARSTAQVWPAPDQGSRLSRQACRRPALGARAEHNSSFGRDSAFAVGPLHSKRADGPSIRRIVPTSRSTKGCNQGTYGTFRTASTPNTRRLACQR